MKPKISLLFSVMAILAVLTCTSCGDDNDDFTHVSAFEQQIHNEVNAYRESNGASELALQFLLVKEAQEHSTDWAEGNLGDDLTQGLTDRVLSVKEKIGGTTSNAFLSSFGEVSAKTIVDYWISDPDLSETMLGEYTVGGPGVAYDNDGNTYVTYLFLNIPSK